METVSARIWTFNQFALSFSPPCCIYPVRGHKQKHPGVRAEMAPLQTGTGTNNHRWYNNFPDLNVDIRKISGPGMSKVVVALMFVMVKLMSHGIIQHRKKCNFLEQLGQIAEYKLAFEIAGNLT